MEAEIAGILEKLDIPTASNATDILKTILLAAVTEPDSFDLNDQYDKLGRAHHLTRERVRQIISHTIGRYWRMDTLMLLRDHFGYPIDFSDEQKNCLPVNGVGKPVNAEFVRWIASNLRLKYHLE